MQAAWNKYGEDCFKFEVVKYVANPEDLLKAEQVWLDKHAGKPYCYNWAIDASAPMRGKKHTDETRIKLKEAAQKVPKGDSSVLHRVPRTEETKTKISAAQLGVRKPIGRRVSEEGLVKLRAAAKRGKDSHFYGQRPAVADLTQKPIRAIKRDRSEEVYKSLVFMRDTLGISITTIIRACKTGKPIRQGICDGWVLSYASEEANNAPEIPEEFLNYPRTRQEAKELGAKQYFTGIPCERNHLSPRKAKGTCIACMKEDYKKDKRRKINLQS